LRVDLLRDLVHAFGVIAIRIDRGAAGRQSANVKLPTRGFQLEQPLDGRNRSMIPLV
jgi:hypothetical protein